MLRRMTVALLTVACVLVLFSACSSSDTEEKTAAAPEAGPKAEDAVRAFYDHLNAGREAEALALYIEASRTAMSAPSSGFGEWAKSETKNGTIQSVEIEPVTIPGGTVNVPFTLVYQDGTRAQRSVPAYKITGSWLLGNVEAR